MKIFDQKQFKSSVEKNALPSPLIFCQYYLRTKINVLRKVCSEVKGINWKVKEGGGACEGGEGGEEEEMHVTFPTNHHWRNFPRENFANASPSDRKRRIQS